MGVVFGTLAYLILFGVINATGATPKVPDSALGMVPYLVVAFVAGYREATFRDLIKKATDLLLSPGGVTGGQATFTPAALDFGQVPSNSTKSLPITVKNIGGQDVAVHQDGVVVDGDAFQVQAGAVPGSTLQPGTGTAIDITFAPHAAQRFDGRLTVHTSVGALTANLAGEGV
jgi:archaellum component FlaG (FlaF/FlaG flagellin family)